MIFFLIFKGFILFLIFSIKIIKFRFHITDFIDGYLIILIFCENYIYM